MAKVRIYEKIWCPYCKMAKEYFKNQGVEILTIDVEQEREEYIKLKDKYNMHTVPMIFIDEKMIGGFSDLMDLKSSGELDKLI